MMPAISTSPASAQAPPPVRSRAGEAETLDFGAVYEAHARAIYYLALRLLGDATRAADAAQDVFLKAFRNLAGFRQQSEIRTWLYRITLNHCQNLRQTWHQRNIQLTDDGTLAEPADGNRATPFHAADARELGERIQKTLESIPEEYRILLLLVADEGMTYEEIGELTRQTSDAVRGKLYRARKAFAAVFKQTV